MSRFYGVVKGGRGEATRCGHANTGLDVQAGSYSGGVFVRLYVDDDDRDCAYVYIDQWQHSGPKERVVLYSGPLEDVSGAVSPLAIVVRAAARARGYA